MEELTPSASTTAPGIPSTITELVPEQSNLASTSVVRIELRKPKQQKKVGWTTNTVDNEDMGKKKSKCCCIYKKPTVFGESSSESEDDECEHCFGHPEKRKKKHNHHHHHHHHDDESTPELSANDPPSNIEK